MRKQVLFITGSINQTTQMHHISRQLPEYDCWFSQLFADSKVSNALIQYTPIAEKTILSGQFKKNAEKYLRERNLRMDYRAQLNEYDLVVYCSDLIIPKRMRRTKTIWVQEGMIDKITSIGKIIRRLGLPVYLTGDTSLNGSTNICDIYCAASEGYKSYLAGMGTEKDKIFVTGLPNYDNIERFRENRFPYHDYVMVATTDMRETFRYENRPAFIKKAVKIADGRRLLFKLHPNENSNRAKKEIQKYAPAETLVFDSGSTNEMIANCCELITQYSTVVYVGMALGKKVHSWFDINVLNKQMPIQNNGSSSRNIANICRNYLEFNGSGSEFLKRFKYAPVIKEQLQSEVVQ
jgi:hypothetical protein